MKDALGDRMKGYEKRFTQKLMPLLPICVRLDGKKFSSWTKGLDRPYDLGMSTLMQLVTKYLVEETQATIGYTQSDEISLIYYSDNRKSQLFFDSKAQKMCSVLAAMATAIFNQERLVRFEKLASKPFAVFDCRVWQVPTLIEAVNTLMWREFDATKNSITQAAATVYSHRQLMNKNSSEKIEMLFQKGIEWQKYPAFFKRGTYVKKMSIAKKLTETEIACLPEKHHARNNPDYKYTRSEVRIVNLPKITTWANSVDFVFNNAPLEVHISARVL